MGSFLAARITATTLTLTAALALSAAIHAAPGDLDGSFGAGGTVVTPLSAGIAHEFPTGTAIQADDKIVVVGIAVASGGNDVILVARYNSDGSLDHTFGSNGKTTTSFGSGTSHPFSVAVQPDNKIVVAGAELSLGGFALARYNPDGSLDVTFDNDGLVTTQISNSSYGFSMALQSDYKIVVAGSSAASGENQFTLARYNTNGSLDASFGNNGIVVTPGRNVTEAYSVVIQPDGKIIAGGIAGQNSFPLATDFALVRYNVNGSLDTTFGNNGVVVTNIASGGDTDDILGAIKLQPDGKIVAFGSADTNVGENFVVVRYNTDGSLDTSFGINGIITTTIDASENTFFGDALIQPNGKIVAVGYADMGSETGFDFLLARYNENGSLDSSFNNNGIVTTNVALGANTDAALRGILQPDGKIVAVGLVDNGIGFAFALARYFGDAATNTAPNCSAVAADISVLATPSHAMQLITLGGAYDADGDALTFTITGVTQDEPVNGNGDGDTAPDAQAGPAANQVYIRGERSGKGDGRVYRIAYTVTDAKGGACSSANSSNGTIVVSVPRNQNGAPAIDSGAIFNSFGN